MRRNSLPVLAAFAAGIAVAIGGVVLLGDHAFAGGSGPMGGSNGGMMSGSNGGTNGNGMMDDSNGSRGAGMMGGGSMMGGGMMAAAMMGAYWSGSTQSSVTPAELVAVRDRVERQLTAWGYKGFSVGEIMAFGNNDYILVEDAAAKPAFELLTDPKGRWIRPEPGPNMMWNTSYGTMRGVSVPGCPGAAASTGSANGAPLTAAQAKVKADAWLADRKAGASSADATALPGYYTIDVTSNGKKSGMLSVNKATGSVWYHSWHGDFLADQDY